MKNTTYKTHETQTTSGLQGIDSILKMAFFWNPESLQTQYSSGLQGCWKISKNAIMTQVSQKIDKAQMQNRSGLQGIYTQNKNAKNRY